MKKLFVFILFPIILLTASCREGQEVEEQMHFLASDFIFLEGERWNDINWDNTGLANHDILELEPFMGNPITGIELALEIGEIIHKSLDMENQQPPRVLASIFLDQKENIWIYNYGFYSPMYLGSDFFVAIDGKNSEIIKMWVN